jgi:Prokaryotic membrane lipoprotein lipid attachment site
VTRRTILAIVALFVLTGCVGDVIGGWDGRGVGQGTFFWIDHDNDGPNGTPTVKEEVPHGVYDEWRRLAGTGPGFVRHDHNGPGGTPRVFLP